MKRIVIVILIIIGGVFQSFAQQIPQTSHYMFYNQVNNPAVAGASEYFTAVSNNRYQWVGITDAPRTYTLSVSGPHKSLNMGYGGYIYSDVTGPTKKSGVYGTYAYNVRVAGDTRLSFGLGLGLVQYYIDGTQIEFQTDDNIVLNELTDYMPDVNFGLYLFAPKYYFGISANQLSGSKIKVYDVRSNSLNQLKNHFSVMGGYKFNVNSLFDIEPSFMLMTMAPVPIDFNIGTKVIYDNSFWGGLSYRTSDAVTVLFGYIYDNQISFGYSYDVVTSNIKNQSSGTHEIMICIKFDKIKTFDAPKL